MWWYAYETKSTAIDSSIVIKDPNKDNTYIVTFRLSQLSGNLFSAWKLHVASFVDTGTLCLNTDVVLKPEYLYSDVKSESLSEATPAKHVYI